MDEDRLAVAQRGRDRLALTGRYVRAIEKHPERIAEAAFTVGEHSKHVEGDDLGAGGHDSPRA